MTLFESTEVELLKIIAGPKYVPAKPKRLAKMLGLTSDDVAELRRLIRRLASDKKIHFGADRLVRPLEPGIAPPRREGLHVSGVFRRQQSGAGWVRPRPDASKKISGDIYIPQENCRDAASGDMVLVKLDKRSREFPLRPRGEVIEIIERDTSQFVGTYFERGGDGLVQVDGKMFAQPISVGDASAKRVQTGDKVVIEMVHFPSHVRDGEAVVIEKLGKWGEPGVDTMTIIREFELPDEFPEEVLADARLQRDSFEEVVLPHQTDLTGETIITIDPIDARDFDDAISLSEDEKGHFRLGVHIADVGHFVREGSVLDQEARRRATSVYLPDRVLPMLPELISNALASLQPHRLRYTKTVFIEFTPEGVPVDVQLAHTAIRSARRFTYEEVDDYIADPAPWKQVLTPAVFSLLKRMRHLAAILKNRRKVRGALELTLKEVQLKLDANGTVVGAVGRSQTESHQIIEEFMLAANEAVARSIAQHNWAFLRRVHASPEPRKLKLLTQFMRELGLKVDDLQDRFALQRLLTQVADKPEVHAVNFAVLRNLPRAAYSPAEEGHFALASDCYCHFTSPIRRYPDLTIHRLVDTILAKKKPTGDAEQLASLGVHCSDRERRAESAERELTRIKLLSYLSGRVGEEMEAVITGVESYGMFVQGLALPADGFVHISALGDEVYDFDRETHTLQARSGKRFRLGDVVRVVVARVDVDERELDFRLAGGPVRSIASRRKSPSKRGRKPTIPHGRSKRRRKS